MELGRGCCNFSFLYSSVVCCSINRGEMMLQNYLFLVDKAIVSLINSEENLLYKWYTLVVEPARNHGSPQEHPIINTHRNFMGAPKIDQKQNMHKCIFNTLKSSPISLAPRNQSPCQSPKPSSLTPIPLFNGAAGLDIFHSPWHYPLNSKKVQRCSRKWFTT